MSSYENKHLTPSRGGYPGFTEEHQGTWQGNFIFIQAADTQLGLIDNYAGNPPENRVWDEEIKLTKRMIQLANEMSPRPKFFIVCGDLVDDAPGKEHYEAQDDDFTKLFNELDTRIPLVCVCGNHDVGDAPTRESLSEYRSRHGDDYFSFWVGGVFFIVINTQYYNDASHVPEEYDAHEEWLDQQLNTCTTNGCTHCVVFQHIPWFVEHPNEDKFEVGHYPNIRKDIRLRMLSKLKGAGVRCVFAGHYHRNAGGFDEGLEMVVTSAIGAQFGNDESGARVVKVTRNSIQHKYYGLSEWPCVVDVDDNHPLP